MYVPSYALSDETGFVKWLIIKIIVGKRYFIDILYDYYVAGKSPKEIAVKYGVNRNQVHSIIANSNYVLWYRKYKPTLLKNVVAKLHEVADRIPSIAEPLGKHVYWCHLCNFVFTAHNIENHVTHKHRDVVDSIVNDVIHMISI